MFQRKTKRRNSRQNRRRNGLGTIESLEDRQLMAADLGFAPTASIVNTPQGPALLIAGTNANDRVSIVSGDEQGVTVRASSVVEGVRHEETYSFDGNQFDEINFVGMRGNDYLSCSTDHDLKARGDGGHDVLHGCSGENDMRGGDGNDVLYGKAKDDTLRGEAGDDRIFARGGDDFVVGGVGNDRIYGEAGDDDLIGSEQSDVDPFASDNDYMSGGSGKDWMVGGRGQDTMYGGLGNDTIKGQQGNDRLYGGSGRDTIEGGDGIDIMYGGTGNDTMRGGNHRDYLFGEYGNDNLQGGDGLDYLYGGNGSDRLDGGNDGQEDRVWGDAGADTFVRHKSVWGANDPYRFMDLDDNEGDEIDVDWHW